MRRRPFRWRTGVAILGGLAIFGMTHAVLVPAPYVRVAELTQAVPAQRPIPARDVRWMVAEHPPASVLTEAHRSLLQVMVTQVALPAGASIPFSALVPPGATNQLRAGEVPWAVSLGGPLANYLSIGGRVSIWAASDSNSALQRIASGARVINLGTGSPPTVAVLAVPQAALARLLTLTTVTLEPFSPPAVQRFTWGRG